MPASKVKVLLLEAGVRGAEESERIRDALRSTDHGRSFEVVHHYGVSATQLIDLVTRNDPTVVHFTGHTVDGELAFQGPDGSIAPADARAISRVFGRLSRSVRCVVLNACDSVAQAELIARDIGVVIAHRGPIQDRAAIEFAVEFYRALGNGASFEDAYACGREQIALAGLPERDVPRLILAPAAKTSRLALAPAEVEHATAPPRRRGRVGRALILGVALMVLGVFVSEQGWAPLASLVHAPAVRSPSVRPLDDKRACSHDEANTSACMRLGARKASEGDAHAANYYYGIACRRGDALACSTLAPSPEAICDHTMTLLARSPDAASQNQVSDALRDSCAADLVEQAKAHDRDRYERYASCVLDSQDHDALLRCRRVFAKAHR